MNDYQGVDSERPQGGGKYNRNNIGHEVHNYLGVNGKYYGFVESGVNNTIHVEKLCGDTNAAYAENVLVVWVARKPSGGGQFIVGWYKNATVYRELQDVPEEAMEVRSLKSHSVYNIYAEDVFLLDPKDRLFQVEGMGQNNIWYGDKSGDLNERVMEYISDYKSYVPSSEVGKLRYIKASDNISFSYNFEVLNACFGADMHASLQHATWEPGDGCLVWFPHLAKIENGRYVPGSSEVNWKNYFEDDNKDIIIQMLYPGEMVNANGKEPSLHYGVDIRPSHTFMKMGERDFRYVGTFMLDYNSSSLRYHVSRRIKEGIDLSIWESGHDMKYFDMSQIGKDVFKSFYVDKDYKQQKAYITRFLEKDKEYFDDEVQYDNIRKTFTEKYSLIALSRMGAEQYENSFAPELADVLNSLFEASYNKELILEKIGQVNEFGRALVDLLHDTDTSINDRIRNSIYGSELAAQIYTLYDKDGYAYLYTLSGRVVENFNYALGIKSDESVDLVAKQSYLYFWRYCDETILDWSIYRFYQFLCFMASIKRRTIQYVAAPRADVKKRIEEESKKLDDEVCGSDLAEAPKNFEYSSSPRASEIKASAKVPKEGNIVPRHADRRVNALVRAGYHCEIDKNHPTFKRRNSDKDYTETHHLIPLEFSSEFEYTLDTEENIVSLCSNCHNQIHYGEGAEKLLKQLFDERKDALYAAGLDKTIKGVTMDFQQLLHMYGLD